MVAFMPFLAGSLAFERYSIDGFDDIQFGEEQLDLIRGRAAGQIATTAIENIHVGFLGGNHLFDLDFDLGKNVINQAVHAAARIDSHSIPAAIKNAWLQIELQGAAKDHPEGRISKARRQEAKEAVEQRCQTEAAAGKYRRMQQVPFLWDLDQQTLLLAASGGSNAGHCADLLESVLEIGIRRISAGTIAMQWAEEAGRFDVLDDLIPADFVTTEGGSQFAWANEHSTAPDFLGNEFLLWLWWRIEHESDTFELPDQSEAVVMMNKTLTLECPRGESGKETIRSEAPTKLPEALTAIRGGKLPRKSGLSIVRDGQQFDLVLQAESFAISGAKIHRSDEDEFHPEDRIDEIRRLIDTVDQMFHVFCERRTGAHWQTDLTAIRHWLSSESEAGRQVAA
jgi:hypothetical protein